MIRGLENTAASCRTEGVMKDTTLCYIEKDGAYLMLHRNKKENDLNEGKWIGVGGHVEPGESPEECIRREVTEETGLVLSDVKLRGVIDFISDRWEDEAMYLYTSDYFSGELQSCNEGELHWVPKDQIFTLPLWEGDRIFLNYLLEEKSFFHLRLHYDTEDHLKSSRLLPPVILASASPRRRELLLQIDIDPAVIPSSVEEVISDVSPEEIVKSLSRQKARDVAGAFSDGEIIIGADTIVVSGGKILGKPHTHEEAAEMIRSLSGHTHEVLTGVTIIRAGEENAQKKEITFAERTYVRVAEMTEAEIMLYAESGEPMDKAGAYGIQGTFAAFIEGIDGDYSNVVGLPLRSVYRALKSL